MKIEKFPSAKREKKISRRDFLKKAGIIAGGAALAISVPKDIDRQEKPVRENKTDNHEKEKKTLLEEIEEIGNELSSISEMATEYEVKAESWKLRIKILYRSGDWKGLASVVIEERIPELRDRLKKVKVRLDVFREEYKDYIKEDMKEIQALNDEIEMIKNNEKKKELLTHQSEVSMRFRELIKVNLPSAEEQVEKAESALKDVLDSK